MACYSARNLLSINQLQIYTGRLCLAQPIFPAPSPLPTEPPPLLLRVVPENSQLDSNGDEWSPGCS